MNAKGQITLNSYKGELYQSIGSIMLAGEKLFNTQVMKLLELILKWCNLTTSQYFSTVMDTEAKIEPI